MSKIAVIFAAGIGIRLQPLTITQHKSLILLKTKPLIEVIITYLLLNPAIVEIIVITGYQQEKFAYLPKKYPKVTNIYNRYYLTKKSAFVLRLIRTKLQGKHSLYFISGDFVMKSNCFLTNITSNVMAAMRKPATLVANWSYLLNRAGEIIDLVISSNPKNLLASEWVHINQAWAKIIYHDIQNKTTKKLLATLDIGQYLISNSIKYQVALTPYIIDNKLFWDLDNYDDLQRIKNEFN